MTATTDEALDVLQQTIDEYILYNNLGPFTALRIRTALGALYNELESAL